MVLIILLAVRGVCLGTFMNAACAVSPTETVEVPNIGDLEDGRIRLIRNMLYFKKEQRYKMKQVCEEIPTSEGQWRIFQNSSD